MLLRWAEIAVVLAIAIAAPAQSQAPAATNAPGPKPSHRRQDSESAAAVREFSAGISRYEKLRDQAGRPPHKAGSARKIAESRAQLQARIQASRANARPGDIFTETVARYFRKQLALAFRGPDGPRVLASLRRAEPVNARVEVNRPYPEGIPLQSMPASLLLRLPTLPKGLQYRFVGRALILLDTAPNLVLDLLPNALPASAT